MQVTQVVTQQQGIRSGMLNLPRIELLLTDLDGRQFVLIVKGTHVQTRVEHGPSKRLDICVQGSRG